MLLNGKNIILLLSILLVLIGETACNKSKQKLGTLTIDGESYVSVHTLGAKGNGQQDDRAAIQKALNQKKNVFFPRGIYLLKSQTDWKGCLVISGTTYPAKLKFAEGAILKVDNNFKRGKNFKPSVLFIEANNYSIKEILIDGLNIDGNQSKHKVQVAGLTAYEYPGHNIEKLILRNTSIKDVGWCGICTFALSTEIYNLKTTNCGNHAIAVNNTRNPNQEHTFYLDTFLSKNDKTYSIDFGGGTAAFPFTGVAKNIRSIDSALGIKTAGYWNLDLINVKVTRSANNGFFINRPAPGKKIRLKNFTVEQAKNIGFALSEKTAVQMDSCTAIDCKMGLSVNGAQINANHLFIQGNKEKESYGMRIKSPSVNINQFNINNISSANPYAVWLEADKAILQNGLIDDNNSTYSMIIKGKKGNILLKEVNFEGGGLKGKNQYGLMNTQKSGEIELINCNFSKMQNRNEIINKSKFIHIHNIKKVE